jgi:membrane protein required for colicin V production
MSNYDIAMLILLGGATFFGYQRGFMRQLASITSIVIGYLVAINFREPLSKVIAAEEPWNKIAAMAILFVATSLLVWSIYASAQKSLKKMELKGFDHQLGALLGGVKGLLICCLITMFAVSLLGPKAQQTIHESRSGHFFIKTIYQGAAIIPKEIWPYLDPHFRKFDETIGNSENLQHFQNYSAIEEGSLQDPRKVPRYQGEWFAPSPGSGGTTNPNPFSHPSNPQDRQTRSETDYLTEIQDLIRDPQSRAAAEKAWEWLQRQADR